MFAGSKQDHCQLCLKGGELIHRFFTDESHKHEEDWIIRENALKEKEFLLRVIWTVWLTKGFKNFI